MTDEPGPEPTTPKRPRRRRAAPASPVVDEPLGEAVTAAADTEHAGTDEAAEAAPAKAITAPAEPGGAGPATPAPPERPTTGRRDVAVVERLDFERGAIGGVRASEVTARQAAIGGIAAGKVSVEGGYVSGIAAREVTVKRGIVRGMVTQNARVEQALVRSVVANRLEAGPTTAIMIAIARRIDGEAKVVLDWRGALAFGTVLGAAVAIGMVARRRG